jgi:hypothetical protein
MIEASDRVTLPIGVTVDGKRYREVVIDEMTGVDEENLASKKVRNNGAKAITLLLRRCIQEIPGVMERKKNPMALCDEAIIRSMYVADRDYLMLCIRAISGKAETLLEYNCQACNAPQAEVVRVDNLDVYEWDDSDPEVYIELPRGFLDPTDNQYKNKLVWRFIDGKAQENISAAPENQMGSAMIVSGLRSVEGMDHLPSTEDVRRLSLRDREAIADAIVSCNVGADPNIECVCSACGDVQKVEINLAAFFSSATPQAQKGSKDGTSGRRLRKKR